MDSKPNDKQAQQKAKSENATPKPPRTWGLTSAEFLLSLKGKTVSVITMDSKEYRGYLNGVDIYDFLLEIDGKLNLFAKHAVKKISEANGK